MSRYAREFDTDWDTLDKDEATEHAYAIGVAERLGEYNREELERIYAEMTSAYQKSMVELAYDEGRNEAQAVAERGDADESAVWDELVTGETTYLDEDEPPTGGRDGLPEALEPSELLDRQAVDSTDRVDRPDFLDR
ncbi:hypothetical protein ACFQL1_09595 [Halomicroarcula sp. GCM10025709]|uniref:hypothetical protein n=1 Tax=Haloarcula TaxID=2237 RepID=UPI0024C34DD3|nr:hypothetical protein [Halomicroarcula sp. YJ-61-S]